MSSGRALPPTLAANPRLGDWLHIGPDGTVEVRSGKIELAQTSRSAAPDCWMDRLPAVMPSSGLRSVAAAVIRIRFTSTSSSSATICASVVRTP